MGRGSAEGTYTHTPPQARGLVRAHTACLVPKVHQLMCADHLGPEEARARCWCLKSMAVTFSCWFSGQEPHGLRVTTTCRRWTEVIFEDVFLCVIDLGVPVSGPVCSAGGAGVSTVLFPVGCARQSDRVVLEAPGLDPGRLV